MKISITSSRRDTDYLWRCVNALAEHGFPCPTVCYDQQQRGPAWNFIWAITQGADLVIQDDFCVTSTMSQVSLLAESTNSKYPKSILSLYTHGYAETDDFIDVIVSDKFLRAKNCNGGCAFYLSFEASSRLIDWYLEDTSRACQPIPCMIGEFCHNTGFKYLISPVNIGDHIGEVSSISSRPKGFLYPLVDRKTL